MIFYWTVRQLADMILARIENDFDNFIVISGRRGIGKSETAVKLGYLCKPFNPHKQITFSREQLMDMMHNSQKKYIIADEMINVAHNREFFNQQQIQLIKMINMYRDNHNIVVACVPNFAHLDSQLRQLVTMRLHIERRGFGVVHVPHQSIYAKDQWNIVNNEKIENTWMHGNYQPKYQRLSTFKGFLKIKPLTKKQRLLYDQIKRDKRNRVYTEGVDTKVLTIQQIGDAPDEEKGQLLIQFANERNIQFGSAVRQLRDYERIMKLGSSDKISNKINTFPKNPEKSPLPLQITKEG